MAGYLELGPINLFLKPKIRVPSGLREEKTDDFRLSVILSISKFTL